MPVVPTKDAIVPSAQRQAPSGVSRRRKRIALGVAAMSDVVQMALFPTFVEGAASPFDVTL